VGFKDLDGFLSNVSPVVLRRDKLILHLVELDPFLEGSRALL
jgi:hypothetical protein